MPKKKQHGAVLSCDPSFRHCSWTLYCPDLSYSKTKVYDICQGYKAYDKLDILVRLVADHLDMLFEDFYPAIEETTLFVIEGQFKTAMTRLKDAIVNQLYARIRELKLVIVPAYSWRDHFSIGGDNYYRRKQASVKFLSENPQLLCWLPGIKDDNIAESIILLNFVVQKQALEFLKPTIMESDDDTQSFTCATCRSQCIVAISSKSGRQYWKCVNTGTCSKADEGGFACFVGEENKPKPWEIKNNLARSKPKFVTKRKYDAPPPTPSRKKPAPSTADAATMLLQKIVNSVVELRKEVTEQRKLLQELSRPAYSADTVTDLYCNDDEEGHGITDFYDDEICGTEQELPSRSMPKLKNQ